MQKGNDYIIVLKGMPLGSSILAKFHCGGGPEDEMLLWFSNPHTVYTEPKDNGIETAVFDTIPCGIMLDKGGALCIPMSSILYYAPAPKSILDQAEELPDRN